MTIISAKLTFIIFRKSSFKANDLFHRYVGRLLLNISEINQKNWDFLWETHPKMKLADRRAITRRGLHWQHSGLLKDYKILTRNVNHKSIYNWDAADAINSWADSSFERAA